MFYTYDQNNSGGSFHHDAKAGIGFAVVIEADSSSEADDRAEQIGLYFNGCDDERDCPCCGDRWYRAWSSDGTEIPEMYGHEVVGGWGISSYIHYKDGRIEEKPDVKSE